MLLILFHVPLSLAINYFNNIFVYAILYITNADHILTNISCQIGVIQSVCLNSIWKTNIDSLFISKFSVVEVATNPLCL